MESCNLMLLDLLLWTLGGALSVAVRAAALMNPINVKSSLGCILKLIVRKSIPSFYACVKVTPALTKRAGGRQQRNPSSPTCNAPTGDEEPFAEKAEYPVLTTRTWLPWPG